MPPQKTLEERVRELERSSGWTSWKTKIPIYAVIYLAGVLFMLIREVNDLRGRIADLEQPTAPSQKVP